MLLEGNKVTKYGNDITLTQDVIIGTDAQKGPKPNWILTKDEKSKEFDCYVWQDNDPLVANVLLNTYDVTYQYFPAIICTPTLL